MGYVSKAGNSIYAEITDLNNGHINHVVLNFLTVPVLSEADIHPIKTVCDCNTFKIALDQYTRAQQSNTNEIVIREVLCPDIAAALLAVQDDSSTFSKFVSMSRITQMNQKHLGVSNECSIAESVLCKLQNNCTL